MKTEKEFSDYFVDSCSHEPVHRDLVISISKTYWMDLTTHLSGYFSNEDRLEITKIAALKLSENLNSNTPWAQVIRNFTQTNQWGFKTISKKPLVKQTEEQKIFWQLFKYAWALFQSMIVLKIAVYYFGLESAERPDEISVVWVWLFFGVSAGSLAFFAYRNRNDND